MSPRAIVRWETGTADVPDLYLRFAEAMLAARPLQALAASAKTMASAGRAARGLARLLASISDAAGGAQ